MSYTDAGKRPAQLLFYMPTAEEILKMQCEGKRCVTAFVTKEALKATYKDPYPPFEEKDCLRFLLHDLQHMEKFVDPKFYCEQVANPSNQTQPKLLMQKLLQILKE